MASIVVEDGTGKANANSYISEADADVYIEKHLYGTSFSGSSDKVAALQMATRLIDSYFKFEGRKVNDTQALEFPRFDITDRSGFLIESTTIPTALKDATAELANRLIASDRTADPAGKGFKNLKAGSLDMTPDTTDKVTVLPDTVVKMLSPFGVPVGGATVRVSR